MLRASIKSSSSWLLGASGSCRKSVLTAPNVLSARSHAVAAEKKPTAVLALRRGYAMAAEESNKGVVRIESDLFSY